jgi:hypothetical protein
VLPRLWHLGIAQDANSKPMISMAMGDVDVGQVFAF